MDAIQKIAVIGCGAVSISKHIPALLNTSSCQLSLLVDRSPEQLSELSRQYQIATSQTWEDRLDEFDAAIVALPHDLHEEVGTGLLSAGKHVLMEKPLAITAETCRHLKNVALNNKVVLAVGLARRQFKTYRLAKDILDSRILGNILSFESCEGGIYNWPIKSSFFFDPAKSGGGVLIDTGAHVLDALCDWLGELTLQSYQDDCQGGVESDCEAQFTNRSGLKGVLRLSRIRNMEPVTKIRAEKGCLEIHHFGDYIKLRLDNSSQVLHGTAESNPFDMNMIFYRQIESWISAIKNQDTNGMISQTVDGSIDSIALIEQCYMNRQPIEYSWRKT